VRKTLAALAAFCLAAPALAHITPNVVLVKKGEFLRQALPGASKFFERALMISGPDGAAIREATGWTPSEEDTRVYVGRDEKGDLVGTVVFLWMPSEHGPVGLGVAFDAMGVIRRAVITDVGSEPLAWVRPIIDGGGLKLLEGLSPTSAPDPARLAQAGSGAMTRYYAKVVADGIGRAQRLVGLGLGGTPAHAG
jgi:hypothetical protein